LKKLDDEFDKLSEEMLIVLDSDKIDTAGGPRAL